MEIVGGEAVKQVCEIFLAQNLTFNGFIARVIGELNAVDGVDIEI